MASIALRAPCFPVLAMSGQRKKWNKNTTGWYITARELTLFKYRSYIIVRERWPKSHWVNWPRNTVSARGSACVFFNACTETCCTAINWRHSCSFIAVQAGLYGLIHYLWRLMGCTKLCLQIATGFVFSYRRACTHLFMCVFHVRLQHNLCTKQHNFMRDSCYMLS